MCIRNAFVKVDSELRNLDLKSILFPLMGTGTGRGKLEEKARELIEEAINYLLESPESSIRQVYFLTWFDKELQVCQRILRESNEIEDTCPL